MKTVKQTFWNLPCGFDGHMKQANWNFRKILVFKKPEIKRKILIKMM